MDRRFITVLGVSLLMALVVALVFYQMVAGARRGRRPPKVEMKDLVVAAHPLPIGISLKPADLKTVPVPVAQFPAGCFSKTEEIVGRPVASSILADEPVREARLAPRGSGLGLAPVIPPGMRAVSVKVNEVVGVAGFVLPGMRVDVLVTGHLANEEGSTTKTILQDILVISAGQNIEPDARGQAINVPVVTLLVTPAQAETLTVASEWRIQLVLRNGSDRAIENTPGRRQGELLGRAAAAPPELKPARPRTVIVKVAPPAPPPPRTTDEVVVIRGVQKTVEKVGVREP
ncbi:MAG TPA: Flp pilus assembly protein CpaB [Bryobacteraceae bacterium]|nr:Flp pilus assembly protein CpaB [Bryobacteraceae bacterium]